MNRQSLLIFLLLLSPLCTLATISPAFSEFLVDTYGPEVEESIARRDLGEKGSWGGGDHVSGEKTAKRPIVMVHGLRTIAGDYEQVHRFFLANGYSDAEVYASSYAHGAANWTRDSMECQHIKKFRQLIIAVANFTASQVDVIGYSMGSPTARKAILGGHCVDGGDYLGPPLTQLVHTFVGVAGANRKAVYLCDTLNFLTKHGPCNTLTGMTCHSRFLDDLNVHNGERYEASERIYTIYSPTDEIVGYKDCEGLLVSTINGQDHGLELSVPMTHFGTMLETGREQLNLLNGKAPSPNVFTSFIGLDGFGRRR